MSEMPADAHSVIARLPRSGRPRSSLTRRSRWPGAGRRGRFRFLARGAIAAVLAAGAGSLVFVGTAGTSRAFGSAPGASASGSVLAAPTLDPAKAKKAAIAYLMDTGVSAKQAKLRIARQPGQLTAADRIRRQAPRDVQDVWIDDDGQLMANVFNDSGEKIARTAGATPRLVTRPTEDLQKLIDELAEDTLRDPPANFAGASFEIDHQTNKVLARYLFTADGGTVPKLATQFGDIVTATTEVATLTPQARVQPGQKMLRDSDDGKRSSCTVGWAVQIEESEADPSGPPQGFLTAGHCFDLNKPAASSVFEVPGLDERSTELGLDGRAKAIGEAYVFGPSGDYGYARLNDGDEALPQVGKGEQTKLVRAIEQDPIVGATVCKYGITTGETCGKVVRTDVVRIVRVGRVNFLHKGLVHASYCSENGDSGGPVYSPFESEVAAPGIAAMGIHSAGKSYWSKSDYAFRCGEKANPPMPNDAWFTPLGNIDPAGAFFVKIAGG